MHVYLSSVGCKLNLSEVETMARQFAQSGHHPVSQPELADLSVVNSCTVTHVADRKSRQLIRRLHRANPKAPIIVTGCYSEMSPESVQGIEGVAMVVANGAKGQLVRTAEALWSERPGEKGQGPAISDPEPEAGDRTRALVKIQDGCSNRCTYCIITLARGQEWSRPWEEVLVEVRDRIAAGHREVVLTGVSIGAYGRDSSIDLAQLIRLILDHTDLPRLRLSSIEPWDVNDDLLALWQDDRLCRHLHLPLQSGCNETLRRMGRHYTAAQYATLVEQARSAIPDLAVTTDLIVGFPGETKADFAQSRACAERMAFARLHVFPYSPRPGTPAAQFPDQVPPPVKKRRAQCLQATAKEASRSFREQFVGRGLSALWEGRRRGPEIMAGLTDNYLRVYTSGEEELANTITPVRLTHLYADGLWGQIVS
jgi:threonylcarbamoyladenosine tRNA methylthiotransferase MtaB